MRVVGVDGASGGWVAVRAVPGEPLVGSWVASFGEIVEREADAAVIAVDMPIGLAESGWRESSARQSPGTWYGSALADEAQQETRGLRFPLRKPSPASKSLPLRVRSRPTAEQAGI